VSGFSRTVTVRLKADTTYRRKFMTPESDTKMTGVYLGAIAVEAAIILALWVFGRMFS